VRFDLQLGKEDGTIDVIEIQPHSNTPNSSKLTHTISYTTSKNCYEDILKVEGDADDEYTFMLVLRNLDDE